MAHRQQLKFFELVQHHFLSTNPSRHLKIIEIGSYNVNGSARDFLQKNNVEYLGVDLCPGIGVDLVSYGHKVSVEDNTFEVSISGECFEHDPNWIETFKNMYRMTLPGGLVVSTCATIGRLEHGTLRSATDHSPGTQSIGLDYYKNLTEEDFYNHLNIKEMFSRHYFFYEKTSYDLYFIGWKKGTPIFSGDINAFLADVANIKTVAKFRFKIFDLPIYIARKCFPENKFQDFSCTYLAKISKFRKFIRSLSR